ncbi:carboxypeptidase regulatory-like domain-containing protein [bacterium]|nr:carboxypeptidase regulatory-like domain-containing protein [bacterium]
MRLFASEISLRWCRQFLLATLVSVCWVLPAFSQNVTLRSPQVVRGGSTTTTIMFRAEDVVTVRWQEANSDLNLKIGQIPGTYGLKSIRMRGDRESSFSPEVVGLPVGVYYGVLTNATSNSFTEIQIEASTNPDIRYSTEFLFVIESLVAPRVIAPRGTITDRVPTFEWEPVPGVVSYAIIISSTPFTISSGPSGEPNVEGINPVWLHSTTNTAALYGERPETNPLVEFNPLPLVPGQTYYYTILNAYSKSDPGLLSYVIGNVVSFSLENRGMLTPANLVYPTQNVRIAGEEVTEFSWEPVDGAISYDVSVYERIKDVSAISDVQVFSGNTPNPFITISSKSVFRQSEYRWFVIANDREGAGSVSGFGTFRYAADMGTFEFSTTSSSNGAEILGVVVKGRSTDGGYTPPNSWINSNGSAFLDSLVVGNYEFKATKIGFADKILPVQIRKGVNTSVPISMDPLPSRINGQVVDDSGFPVENATLNFVGVPSGETFSTKSGTTGVFSRDLSPGTFRITATKAGFRASIPITVSVLENQVLSLPLPLEIVDDHVSISGRVVNQDGIPISGVPVTAVLGAQSHTIVTNGDGRWSLALSEGIWSVFATKDGFLAPIPRALTLFAGDVLENVDFILVQQASRIEGTAFGVRTLSDGRTEQITLGGAHVTAYPLYGEGIQVDADNLGRYVLDLGTGFYSVFASAEGYEQSSQIDLMIRPNEIFRDVNFSLNEFTSTVFGRVVSAGGEGIEGAEVQTSDGQSTLSQTGGTFVLQLSANAQTLRASKKGLLPSKKTTVALGPNSQVSGVVLTLHPNAADVSGTVRSQAGPLAGVRIVALSGNESYETTSDAGGHYVLQMPGGTWQIQAASPRYRLPDAISLPIRAGQTVESFDLIMKEDYVRLDGFVKYNGVGVKGAMINAVDVNQSRGIASTLKTISGASGRYTALLSASTRFDLEMDEPGFNPFRYSLTTDLPGATLALDLPLVASEAVIKGKVKDAEGKAVSGANVAIKVGGITQFSTITSTDGSFQLNVEKGSYEMVVSSTGFESASVSLSVSAGQRLENISITLESSQSTLIATILDPRNGSLIVGASLSAIGPGSRTGISSSEGVVTFSGLPAGIYQITVRSAGFVTVARSVSIPSNVTSRQTFVMVPVFGKINGRVVDSSSNPIPGATLRLEGGTYEIYAQSGADGSYQFESLPDGGYAISAQKNGYSLAPSVQVTLSSSNRTAIAPTIQLVKGTGLISGLVQDEATSSALSGVVIVATSQFGVKSARSNALGAFEITGLESGSWTLTASLDNYRYSNELISVQNGQTTTTSIGMRRNQAVLTGRIRSTNGSALPFDVSVEVKTTREEHQVFTSADGRFVIDQLPQGEKVVLRTRIQRENYRDIERVIPIGNSETQLSLGDVGIVTLSSAITGSAGLTGVTITILDAAGATVAVATSIENGTFKVPFLEAGSYEVIPTKLGHQFAPTRRTLTVSENEVGTASFSATSNLGLVTIQVRRQDGTGVFDVPVRVSSFDRSIDQTLRTDANGTLLPQQLPLGLRYRIEPVSTTRLFDPAFIDIDLGSQAEATASFTVFGINSFLSGQTKDTQGSIISGVTVTAKTGLSQDYLTESTSGEFTLGPLPPGTYVITGRKTGFIPSSTTVTVAENATVSGIQLALQRQSVEIRGTIVRAGQAVPGLTVSLSGPLNVSVVTNTLGTFSFTNVPVSETGETVIEISVQRPGRPPIVRRISVSNANVGQTIDLEPITLASGKITVELNDGIASLAGVEVLIRGQDGGAVQGVTNSNGVFETGAVLDPGNYTVEILNTSLLQPSTSSRQVVLLLIDSEQRTNLVLPFAHTPKDIIRSDQPVVVSVSSVGSTAHLNRSAKLSYQLPGQAPEQIVMAFENGAFVASIPPPGEGKIQYFVEVLSGTGSVEYSSSVIERTTVVSGQLQETRLFPNLNGQILRVSDQYGVALQIRDGLGVDISEDVLQRGQVQWISVAGDVGIDTNSGGTKLTAIITPRSQGTFAIEVRIALGSKQSVVPIEFEARSVQVSSLLINAQSTRVVNQGGTSRFSVSGTTQTGGSVLLGNSVFWTVEPSVAATINQSGTVTTENSKYIGPLAITVLDAQSGASDSATVSVYADINGDQAISLTDYNGMELFIPATSFPFKSELSLSYPRTPSPKRFESGTDGSGGLTSGVKTYRFSLRSDRALLGDSLAAPATLTLRQDPALSLYGGGKQIGHFDESTLSWQALPSFASETNVVTTMATRLGDYNVVVQSQELGIKYLEALPSPFSPEIAPLRIAYFLDTSAPPATVSIHVLNMRGELVKTILDGDQQWAGPYGGSNGLKQIEWDGTTEDNQKARNGRYIIRVTARDNNGSTSRMLPVVLVK